MACAHDMNCRGHGSNPFWQKGSDGERARESLVGVHSTVGPTERSCAHLPHGN